MMRSLLSRENFVVRAGIVIAGLGGCAVYTASGTIAEAAGDDEISHDREAIHQVVDFTADPARVFQALTIAERFDNVVRLSAAMHSGMSLGSAPTQIDAEPGGAFVLFGGFVTGRVLDLQPSTRIVEAWRSGAWSPGAYSIATFQLAPHEAGTRLTFDHVGFPAGEARSLAKGWHENYWDPLAKYLGRA
jgi:activator of HSP90 ATPase